MEAMIGEVRYFAFPFTPSCWLPCEGHVLEIARYMALYSLLGTQFGGDGVTNFAVPTIASVEGHPKAFICIEGIYPIRA